ncbi:MAG: ATP-binding protein [Gammaproteobacteria bacterium]
MSAGRLHASWQTLKAQPPWLWLLCLALVAIAFLPYQAVPLPDHRYALSDGSRLMSRALTPDITSDGDWAPSTLPDDWARTAPEARQIWYWFAPTIPEGTDGPWSVYIPFVSQNAAVYLNGDWMGQGGSMTDPVARNWNQPLMFSFDASRIRPGLNALLVQVRTATPGSGYLGRIYFGPHEVLLPYFNRHFHMRVSVERWVTGALLLFGTFITALWFFRRQDTLYLWFGAAAFCWAAHEFNLFLVEVPFSDAVWEALVILTLGWAISFVIVFAHRFCGVRRPRLERAMLVYATLLALPLAWPDVNVVRAYGYLVWLPVLFPLGAYTIGLLMREFANRREPAIAVLAAAGLTQFILAAHDLLLANFLWNREDAHLLQFGALFSIAIIAVLLIRRFVHALNTAEALTAELEDRVAARERELESNYQRLRQLEHEQVLSSERERIMRDIHDGVGGQMVAALAVIDRGGSLGAARDSIRDALGDLRLVIDSLDSDARDLNTVLGMLRMRLADRLRDADIEFQWQVTDLPELEGFGPRKALQVMRIVQEALTNALKHSGATTLSVSTRVARHDDRDGVCVCVQDNGRGMPMDKPPSGRGLLNQQRRAAAIGARLSIDDATPGVRVVLWLPLGPGKP